MLADGKKIQIHRHNRSKLEQIMSANAATFGTRATKVSFFKSISVGTRIDGGFGSVLALLIL